ncbi:sigma-54 dependent transcriptional regulator [Desulfobulbus oligotrophicus]|jgi:DNA-binding NtrC family response regulator|uniref:Sigma-54-dependent Fis family transcriptional regulator n=1 Tax=Desulfobulbus oligotrophicus TaxID=1909699 RepID=A0A7T5VE33_9BACT|nr:sigma-54 dependent transcriptional regulator [Desulfobulbus oligotrophicus]MDY0391029.1 sigma-54 dependent transcriptional regulator [Desulfobulbus oligotrophicus]QQG66208.1 sigma-54-dependent Fis family transcriptional regulator [Desulfobulbus oligotrophicus]
MTKKRPAILAYEFSLNSQRNIETALAGKFELNFQHDLKSFQSEINKKMYDTIFLNFQPDNDDEIFTLLERIYEQTPSTPIIVACASEDEIRFDKKAEAIIYDILNVPLSPVRIRRSVRQALQRRQQENELAYLRRTQDIVYSFSHIVAESESFKNVIKNLRKFASTDATILITGSTGTGKSFLSATVHYNSPRRNQPFIKINCVNIPETLLESELFGHEKGSFTGADKQRIGRFEQADGGTIFLDEIGEISLEIQAKLLRVLEDKSFERVGGNKTIKVDIRLIAATNKDLPTLIDQGRFREDLYYRISVLPVHLPDLKDRTRCLPAMAMRLLEKSTTSLNKGNITGFTPEAMAMIQGYDWPGNIRQLGNTIERAVILEEENLIGLQAIHIPELRRPPAPVTEGTESLETHERELILKTLAENLWVQKTTARCLGISPRVLNYKIKKFGISHQNWRKNKKK